MGSLPPEVQLGIASVLKRALPPYFLLLFETGGDAAHGVLADPHLAQYLSNASYLPYPEIPDRYISRIASSTSPVMRF
jgi:hypothetical protein